MACMALVWYVSLVGSSPNDKLGWLGDVKRGSCWSCTKPIGIKQSTRPKVAESASLSGLSFLFVCGCLCFEVRRDCS